jgi:DNA-binding transcriptional MerR regulator
MLRYDRTVSSDLEPTAPAPQLLRVNEVALEVGLTARAVRYYEELGLLKPAARSGGAYRLYDDDDVERLRFIRGLRDDAGFSLAEIGRLLEDEEARARNRARFQSTTDTAERRAILVDAMARVDHQVRILREKATRITTMIGEAESRRQHLEAHLADLEAGRQPAQPATQPTAARPEPAQPPAPPRGRP